MSFKCVLGRLLSQTTGIDDGLELVVELLPYPFHDSIHARPYLILWCLIRCRAQLLVYLILHLLVVGLQRSLFHAVAHMMRVVLRQI